MFCISVHPESHPLFAISQIKLWSRLLLDIWMKLPIPLKIPQIFTHLLDN